MENTQKQLKLQEELEDLSESVTSSVEHLTAQRTHNILNNDFKTAAPITENLAAVREALDRRSKEAGGINKSPLLHRIGY